MESIQMKIAKTAARNWGQTEPTTLEESLGITWDSEVAAVKGIAETLELDESVIEQLVGTIDEDGKYRRDGQIYTSDTISPEISEQLQKAIQGDGKNKSILSILSTIHDSWVRNNSDNFLKPGRNKERQFVPLQMLNWGEVESDLLFLKPILEASGIEIDEEQLKQEHELQQQEYMIDNGILSHEDLVKHLSRGSKSYSALEGLETKNGGNIDGLLQDPEVLESMATQIESKVPIRSREELAMDIIKSDNESLNDLSWVYTSSFDGNFDKNKCPVLDTPISKREIMLSKLIGQPYPTYFLSGISNDNHDVYQNKIVGSRGYEYKLDQAETYMQKTMASSKESLEEGKNGRIEFGYTTTGEKIGGSLEITDKELEAAGLSTGRMGWSEITRDKSKTVSPKDIAKADESRELTSTELAPIQKSGIKAFIKNLIDKIKGLGEK